MSNKMDALSIKEERNREMKPKLRFPEFQEEGEWEEYFGNEIFDQINNKQHDSSFPVLAITQEHGAIPRDEIDYRVSVTKKSLESYKVVEVGDFIISLRSFQGGIEYSRYNGICSPAYIILRKNTDDSEVYFKQFFKTERFIQQLQKNLEGLRDGKMVSYKQFSELLLPIPSLAEQQKIADCLASIDELIAAQNQKLDTLQAHKKGLLQQLFPSEGQTLPQLRFPEFRDAPEWNEKRLEKISDIRTGPFGSVLHQSDYVEVGTPIITVEHLGELGIEGPDFPRVSDSDKSRLSSYQLKEGDIVFSRVGSVDRCSIVRTSEDGWLFSGRLLRLRIRKSEENSPHFLNQLLKREPSKVKIRNMAVGQTMPSLNTKILNSISFHLPLFSEQQKIAKCLDVLDEQIATQTQKLDALKAHKKGLMQQLFPSPDEVQG
jgi:type I restriction enzyme, S subunit